MLLFFDFLFVLLLLFFVEIDNHLILGRIRPRLVMKSIRFVLYFIEMFFSVNIIVCYCDFFVVVVAYVP